MKSADRESPLSIDDQKLLEKYLDKLDERKAEIFLGQFESLVNFSRHFKDTKPL